jgi:hypothetical protein
MWLEPLSRLLVGLAMLGQTVAAAPPTSPSPAPSAIVTRQPDFAIPFRVDRTDDPTRQPVEVQLFVSVDRGRRWQLYAKAPPGQQHFLFHGRGEGEYWFAIRTVDTAGKVRPDTISGPGLCVLVDATPPVLKLAAQHDPAGQIVVHWEVNKPNIKPDSLKVQYRGATSEPWQAVTIQRQTPASSSTPQTGQFSFRPAAGTSELQVRAEIADTAGNLATAQTELRIEAARPPETLRPPETPRPPETARPQNGPALTAEPTGSVAIAINPAVGNEANVAEKPPVGAAAPSTVPPGEHPRMINSRLFELEYDVDSVGPSGIGKVELWGTRNGGKTWRRFPLDSSSRSPLLVNVEEEGIYGFRVVVTNGAGIGGKPPVSGDLPDLWIGVDLTKPTARILSARQGTDSESGRLIITWQADDKMLAARPISLWFRADPTGSWLPIASGLENTGRYAWPIDSRTPAELYLRLEVRDEAGNMGVYETPETVSVDQSNPTIRVREIRPVGRPGLRPVRGW